MDEDDDGTGGVAGELDVPWLMTFSGRDKKPREERRVAVGGLLEVAASSRLRSRQVLQTKGGI